MKASLSSIVYDLAINGKINEPLSQEMMDCFRKLAGMANNLNQLAHEAHIAGYEDVAAADRLLSEKIDEVKITMNAKIMKGKSAGGLIDYLNSMKEKNAKVIFSNGVSTTSNRTVVAAFNLQWANSSSKIKDKMGHLVISFSPKDRERLTDEFITELCKEYMQRMKFPPTIYLGYRHLDQEHDHVHIAYSRIDNEGKAITCDSNYARSVNICKSIWAKYGLSAPSKRKKDVNRDRLIGKDKVKYHIMDIAFPILDKAGSWKEYISRLKSEGVDITMVRDEYGNVRGIVYTAENLSFAGKKVDPELSFGNLRRKFGSYGQEKTAISDIRKHDSVFTGSDMNISKDMAHAEACPVDTPEYSPNIQNAQSNQETMAAGNVESGTDSGSSIGSGIVGAAIELIVQPHQAPETGGGGGGSSDDNKRDEEKDKYVPRKGRRR